MEKFWLVWNPEGNSPRYRHPSQESAEREAERLREEGEEMRAWTRDMSREWEKAA